MDGFKSMSTKAQIFSLSRKLICHLLLSITILNASTGLGITQQISSEEKTQRNTLLQEIMRVFTIMDISKDFVVDRYEYSNFVDGRCADGSYIGIPEEKYYIESNKIFEKIDENNDKELNIYEVNIFYKNVFHGNNTEEGIDKIKIPLDGIDYKSCR